MKTYQVQAQHFKVLTHPTRLAILEILRQGEECVCHIEAVLGLRQAHISQHLMVLRDAGLVADRRQGWNIYYRVTRPDIYQVIDAAAEFCGSDLYDLELPLANPQTCTCPKCQTDSATAHLIHPQNAGRTANNFISRMKFKE